MNKISLDIPKLDFAAEEALNRLRVNIKFVGVDTRRIMITSSLPNEGKSVIGLHLWRMLAEAGFPTLFVDLDLRNTVLRARHQMSSEKEIFGIQHFLSGQCGPDDILCETNIPNGWMIPCTETLKNPTILFESEIFSRLMEDLGQKFRYVIVDTPPIMSVSDACTISTSCDAALFVVRNNFTSKKTIRQSLQQLNTISCPLLGVILNRVPLGAKRYSTSKYGYGYSYGYGKK